MCHLSPKPHNNSFQNICLVWAAGKFRAGEEYSLEGGRHLAVYFRCWGLAYSPVTDHVSKTPPVSPSVPSRLYSILEGTQVPPLQLKRSVRLRGGGSYHQGWLWGQGQLSSQPGDGASTGSESPPLSLVTQGCTAVTPSPRGSSLQAQRTVCADDFLPQTPETLPKGFVWNPEHSLCL